MATVSKWTPFGVALDITATGATVTRTSATQFTVKINASWETYYNGAITNYGMTASSGGGSANINTFGNYASSGSGSFTGTYSISGNGAASKTVTVTFKNFNTDYNKSASKSVSFTVSVPAWTSYKISYNANGGSGAPGAQTKWKNQTLTLSSAKPTRSGYTFVGWGTSASDTSKDYSAGGSYTANAAATLYAIWSKTITLTYNANGGSGAPSAQSETIYNATTSKAFTLSSTKLTRSGYTFLGWSTSSTATTAAYSAGGSITLSANDTLYAVWKVAYVKPTITNYTVTRCNSSGTATSSGTYALVKFKWTTFAATPTITLEWGIPGSEAVSTTTVTASGTSGSVSKVIGGGNLSTDESYVIGALVKDSGGSSYKQASIISAAVPLEAIHSNGKYGVAIGKAAESTGYLDVGYKTKHHDNVYFDNAVSISGKNPDGSNAVVFIPKSDSGNTVVGYSNYTDKKGTTNIYGHDVIHYVSNIATPGSYRPYRRAGDTISLTFRTAGYVTNGGKDVSFWLPSACPIVGSPKATAASNNGFILRQGTKYTHGSTAEIYVHPTIYEATVTSYSGIYIKAVFADTTNVTNNDTIGIYWSGIITLS